MEEGTMNKDIYDTMKKGFNRLYEEVISKGLCTVCGTCAGVCPNQSIEMKIEDYEKDEPIPVLTGNCSNCSICYKVCAGKEIPLGDLDKHIFGRERKPLDEPIGIYRRTLKGYAKGKARDSSSSGGITLGVIEYALAEGIIDAAIIALRSKEHPWRAEAGIITEAKDAKKGVRSVMEVVPVNSVLHEAVIKQKHNKVAVVGMPCQIHSIRKLQMNNIPQILAKAIVFTIGLYCNSTAYYIGIEHLVKEIGGIESLKDIIGMDYRAGAWPGSMMALTLDGKIHFIATKSFYGGFLSSANYRRDRCLMCTDFSAELADISVGDIFQNFDGNPRWSGVISRTEIGDQLINGAVTKGYIYIENHNPDLIPASGYGWEMSKHASMYRLMEREKYGWPVPNFQYPNEIKLLRRSIASAKI